jgi:hypothetical protein
MLNKVIRLALLPAAAAVLVACGGGSGGGSANNQRVGQFVDDPVEGLTYQCAAPNSTSTPTSNVTNALGQFNYTDGKSVPSGWEMWFWGPLWRCPLMVW